MSIEKLRWRQLDLSRIGIKFVYIRFRAFVIIYFANIIWEIGQLQIIRPIGRSYFVISRPGNQFSRPFGQRTPSTETLYDYIGPKGVS